MILAIDPGAEQSALLVWDGNMVHYKETLPNIGVLSSLFNLQGCYGMDTVVIEGVACYGMPVGAEVFSTCIWIGRFWQKTVDLGMCAQLVYRRDIKLHHCGSVRAKDSNVRQSLVDKYGPPGTKQQPGVTHGISKHLWSAFAIATWHSETLGGERKPQALGSLT